MVKFAYPMIILPAVSCSPRQWAKWHGVNSPLSSFWQRELPRRNLRSSIVFNPLPNSLDIQR